MKVTIKDVAKAAGVSIATVSRVINHLGGYSEETKNQVLQVIDELGYQPNQVARGLVSNRTRTIAFIVPDLTSTLALELLKGVEKGAHKKGNSVILCNTESEGIKTMDYLKLLHEKRIDGIIFASNELKKDYYEYIQKMHIPLVLLATQSPRFAVPFVKVDDRLAAYAAVEYLMKKGHRKIGIISAGEDDGIAGLPRLEGYQLALSDYGIPVSENRIVRTKGFHFEDGRIGLRRLIQQDSEITAVFAGSDDIAAGIISSSHELGIRVPEDLSIIGYDNLKIAEMVVPPLTTVAQPLAEMGEKACDMIIDMLENGKLAQSLYFPHKIIERKSVKTLFSS